MRKYIIDSFKLILIIITFVSFTISPLKVEAKEATTLAELKQYLKDLQNQKKKNENSQATKKEEINRKNKLIADSYEEIELSEQKIEESKSIIAQSKDEIVKLEDQTEELLRYLQIMSTDNAYIEYATGASSVTDLIMRMSAYEQITDYTTEQLKSLEILIKENEEEQIKLNQFQKDLDKKIANYKSNIQSLGKDINQLTELTMNIDEEIANQKNLIDYYVQSGCKDNELLSKCATSLNNASWKKPTIKGKISSAWGMRKSPIDGKYKLHNGVDIAGNGEGTNVYAIGNGKVAAIMRKTSCGGNRVFLHVMVQGKKYTLEYAHLLSIKVKIGDIVNMNTVIGTVGGYSTSTKKGGYDGCSTGAHLHFGVSSGYYLEEYQSYSSLTANGINPPGFPKKGSWYYSR